MVESWDDGVACAACWSDAAGANLAHPSFCEKCGLELSRAIPAAESTARAKGRLCGMCGTLPFAVARACGLYSGALEASILFLKVNPHICPRLRRVICRTLLEHRQALASDVIIPVPLHRDRKRERGFNQATIIGGLLAREFRLTLEDRSLVRTKPTERHRAGMDAADRAQSVERAFEVVRPRLTEGASVLLVDDVYTTGSTICSATESLLKAGARQVNVLTIARVEAR